MLLHAAPDDDAIARDNGFIDACGRREYFLAAAATLLFSTTTTNSALIAVVFQRAGFPLQTIGQLIGVLAITVLAATLASGYITARLGAVRASHVAMAFAVVGVGSLAWTREHFWGAMGSRLAWGVGVGLFLGPMNLYMQSRLTPKRFVYLVTAFSAMIPLALAIAPPIGEQVLNHFGERALFITGAVPALVAILITANLRALPSPPAPSGLGLVSAWRAWHFLPAMTLVIGGSQFGYLTSYLAPALESHKIMLGWFFLPMTAAMIGCRVFAMRRLASLHPRTLAASGLVGCSLSLAAIAGAQGPLLVAASGVALGLGNSMMYPVMSAWFGRFASRSDGGGVQAIVASAFYVGIYWAPWPLATLIGFYGFSGAALMLAGVGLAGALVLAGSRVDGSRDAGPHGDSAGR